MTMRAPQGNDPSQVPRCSEGRGAVVLDGLMTLVHGLIGVALLSAGEEGPGAAFLLAGSVHLGSAVAGNGSAGRCTKAHEAHAAWRRTALQNAGDEAPPGTTNLAPGQPATQQPATQPPATQPLAPAQPATQPPPPAQPATQPPAATQPATRPPAPTADQETQANPWADFWVPQ